MAAAEDKPDPAAAKSPFKPTPWPSLRWSWADAASKPGFYPSAGMEKRYAKRLKSVAGRVKKITSGPGTPQEKQQALRAYTRTVENWAKSTAAAMVAQVEKQNRQAWESLSGKISQSLRQTMAQPVNGVTMQSLIVRNAQMIKSLPEGAATKIGEIAAEATTAGLRAEDIAAKIMAAGDVAQSRAKMIAHTELSKASSTLTRTRAEAVGSEGYTWRTSRDGNVRDSHRAMEGKFVRWQQPPQLDGFVCHAGEAPNCCCYPEPVVPLEDGTVSAPALPTAAEVKADPNRGILSVWERANKEIVPHEVGQSLVNVDRLVIHRQKIVDYILDPNHERGGNKARVFASVLGITKDHADDLLEQIARKVPHLPAIRPDRNSQGKRTDMWGERFTVLVPITGPNGRTVDVLTGWIYDRDPDIGKQKDVPRLNTCRVSKKELKK